MSIADIKKMTTEERIEAMEHLWDSLTSESELSPPEWHGEILEKRVSVMESPDAKFVTLEEAKDRLRR